MTYFVVTSMGRTQCTLSLVHVQLPRELYQIQLWSAWPSTSSNKNVYCCMKLILSRFHGKYVEMVGSYRWWSHLKDHAYLEWRHSFYCDAIWWISTRLFKQAPYMRFLSSTTLNFLVLLTSHTLQGMTNPFLLQKQQHLRIYKIRKSILFLPLKRTYRFLLNISS